MNAAELLIDQRRFPRSRPTSTSSDWFWGSVCGLRGAVVIEAESCDKDADGEVTHDLCTVRDDSKPGAGPGRRPQAEGGHPLGVCLLTADPCGHGAALRPAIWRAREPGASRGSS